MKHLEARGCLAKMEFLDSKLDYHKILYEQLTALLLKFILLQRTVNKVRNSYFERKL